MRAILVILGTRHAFNVIYVGDKVCLEQFLMRTTYACNTSKFVNALPTKQSHLCKYDASFPQVRFDRKWPCLAGKAFNFFEVLQSYLVLIRNCSRHIMHILWFGIQAMPEKLRAKNSLILDQGQRRTKISNAVCHLVIRLKICLSEWFSVF